MQTEYREYTRPALSGEGEIFCRCWLPEQPRAAVILAHGMCEHSGRYHRIAELLSEKGYAVFTHDHPGHGRSQMGHPGVFSLKGHGFDFVLGEILRDLDQAAELCPGKRRFLIGHSMGSILSAILADRWGEKLNGLILMGTPVPNPLSGLLKSLCDADIRLHGPIHRSPLLLRLQNTATNGNKTGTPEERRSWLSHNVENIREYIRDPLAGFDFSSSATRELADGLREIGSRKWGRGVPKGLPVMVIAGMEDRCGKYGEGPLHYAAQLLGCGVRDVTLRLIPGARHEVLNEIDHREVDETILGWLSERA